MENMIEKNETENMNVDSFIELIQLTREQAVNDRYKIKAIVNNRKVKLRGQGLSLTELSIDGDEFPTTAADSKESLELALS